MDRVGPDPRPHRADDHPHGRQPDGQDTRPPEPVNRVDRLVEFVVALASGRLDTRLTPSPASDEVDAVTVGLNMLGEELEVLTGDLEKRVAERTQELALARQELERLALHDALTALANRTLLVQRLEQALARKARGARPPVVLVLDLDGFKAVNDGFGHVAGDQLLIAVAARLRAAVRDEDLVARLGGDEFAILVEDAAPQEVLDLADRVQHAIAAPAPAGDHTCLVGASIGICVAAEGHTTDSLLDDADTAMYAAKHRTRGSVAVFESRMRHAAVTRTHWAAQLRDALTDPRQLSLVFEPIVELATGRMVGAEALLRWQHPTQGRLCPQSFRRVAEDTGLVTELDRWALEAAAACLAHWRSTVLGVAPFAVHVNVSPRGLRVPHFTDDVVKVLASHGVPAGDVTVEITEAQMLADDVAGVQTITDLRAAGVRVAIDDFGSGPSSLQYVRRSLVDTIKLDQSLVRDVDVDARQQQVTAGVLSVIDAFDLAAVAEGVETTGEAVQLRAMGCSYGQGRYWSLPRPANALMDLWRARPSP